MDSDDFLNMNFRPKYLLEPQISNSFSEEQAIVLHYGDSYESLQAIPSGKVTLIITSPPYNVGKE